MVRVVVVLLVEVMLVLVVLLLVVRGLLLLVVLILLTLVVGCVGNCDVSCTQAVMRVCCATRGCSIPLMHSYGFKVRCAGVPASST